MAAIATQTIDAPTAGLEQVLYRLQEKRVALEKVVLQYGEAPAGIKEVFELCRGFERAYTNFINESPVASKIKEAFLNESGLAGKIKKLPMDKVFELKNVKSVCRQADGYYPSLIAPENGLRELSNQALETLTEPVNVCVQEVYNLCLNAAREAAEKAGQFTEAALMGAMPMYVPDFKNVVMPAIVSALDEWKKDSEKMAHMLVDMERSYITAGFFRHTTHHRYQKIKQQEQMRAAMATKGTGDVKGIAASAKQTAAKFFPSFGPAAGASPAPPSGTPPPANGASVADDDSDDGKSPPRPANGGSSLNVSNAEDFIASYFDKYVSDDSARFLEAMKWQRRFFVFSESQRVLYYFRSPEDVSKPAGLKGQVNIAECIVEDLDDRGSARPPNAGPVSLNTQDKGQLMIRIRHKDPRGVVVKDHNGIILRAESMDTKLTWLVKLRKAAEPRRPPNAPGAAPAGQQPLQPSAGPAAPGAPVAGPGTSAPGAGPVAATAPVPSSTAAPGGFGMGVFGSTFDDGDLSWAKEAEPVLDTHLGEGSSAFRADTVRDSEGRLLPAPQMLLNPLRLKERMARAAAASAPWEVRYDALLDQFSADMQLYMSCICDTITITVPKAIVHCMIRKSEKNLLERLFTVIHHLTPMQLENLLREDEPIIEKRKAARACLEDVKTAIFQVQQVLERQNMSAPADRKDRVKLQALVFAYAGIREMLTPEQYNYFNGKFNDNRRGRMQGPRRRVLCHHVDHTGAGGPPPPPRPVGPGAVIRRPPPSVPAGTPMGAPMGQPMGPPMAAQRRPPPPPPAVLVVAVADYLIWETSQGPLAGATGRVIELTMYTMQRALKSESSIVFGS
ncbi:dynamin-related GTPase [Volvox carteri f. nagariensis]|uniref:Dynamin-related GTPase n=1 Tax=Volvox carteri f. nagariensis TaxID=3068 RepID=D8U896_VOLCA|nr:dynamin-related GTPase [Volvox carteri f. nagariensis]EFJ44103.1 dynamin-related GTPase [Volvox carteri f. nagariensis]|eukprot:XP_002954904.1 dynamin-related GTPase [Volvox carteri f. nagariensis]